MIVVHVEFVENFPNFVLQRSNFVVVAKTSFCAVENHYRRFEWTPDVNSRDVPVDNAWSSHVMGVDNPVLFCPSWPVQNSKKTGA